MMRAALLFVILTLSVTAGWQNALAEDDKEWICIPDAVVGFGYKEGKWVTMNFDVGTTRYLVSKKPLSRNLPQETL